MLGVVIAAAAAVAAHSTIASDGMPPLRFRGDKEIRVTFKQQPLIDHACRDFAAPAGFKRLACTHVSVFGSIITMPNPCEFEFDPYAVLMCHELGHANGWPSTHGD
jgi:hypothetical protein